MILSFHPVIAVLLASLIFGSLPFLSAWPSTLSPSTFITAVDACDGADYGTPGVFDLLILSQSWSPQFCVDHTEYPGCSSPTDWQRTNLTLHGIWPQYNSSHKGHS